MKMIRPAVLALLASSTQARNPGFGGSITQDGMTNAKNVVTPFIFQYLKDIQIPEIDISGGKFTNLDIKIDQPLLSNINLTMDSTTNAVELTATGVSTEMTSDFTFKYIISVDGQADIKIKNLTVDAKLDISTQPGTPTSDLAPKLTVEKLNIGINPNDVDITLTGGSVAKIASILIPIIKSTLLPTIVSQIQTTVKTMIETTIDQDLAKYGTRVTFPYLAGVTLDLGQMLGGPKVTTDNILEAALDGTFFDANAPETYSFDPVAFPLRNPAGKTFQGYLTDYVVNTNLIAAFDTGNTLDITMLIQKLLNITVTTDDIAYVLPEIVTKYGSAQPVTIKGAFVNAPGKASFAPDADSIQLNLAVAVSVGDEVAVSAEFDAITASGLLNAKNGSLFGNIATSTIGTVSKFSTTLGMDQQAFQDEVQAVVNKYVAQANADLAAGVVIPSIMGINVSDVELNSSAGYVEFGMNVTPQTFLDLQDAWTTYKAEFDMIEQGAYKTEKWGSYQVNTETGELFLQ